MVFFFVIRRNHECGGREEYGEFAIALRTSINLDLAECMPIVFLGGSLSNRFFGRKGRGIRKRHLGGRECVKVRLMGCSHDSFFKMSHIHT